MPNHRIFTGLGGVFAVAFFISFVALRATPVLSAPFCVEADGLPAECWYYDLQSCQKEAARRQAYCSANAEELALASEGAPFCVMGSELIPICVFQNRESCQNAATRRNAICVENELQEQTISDQETISQLTNFTAQE